MTPRSDLIVAADASGYGIGAVILHRFPVGSQKAISHANQNLTAAGKNYGLIELWSNRKREFCIGSRSPQDANIPFLQTINLTINIWKQECLTILHSRSSRDDFGRADALSPLIAEQAEQAEYIVIAAALHQAELEKESVKDETLEDVIQCVREDKWPTNKKLIHTLSFSLAPRRLAFLRTKYHDPVKFPNRVFALLHEERPCMLKMKNLARSCVYWTNITKDC
ncbi:unnamed protein product [Haemonchus placei]|uniref:RT_RNaseH domain-containing protein n=1 Tax=Haemonchus placei TaxID=6290 RepID=A0A0N4WD54_HAEPC|nr:unnamed protein product [Haemonchus placei]